MPVNVDERFTLFEHLDELRKRIMWSLIALAVGVLVAAVFNSIVFELLLYPLKQVPGLDPAAYKLTTFSPELLRATIDSAYAERTKQQGEVQ
jgi:Sec-independent protein secretion pathway component TatC